jgi:hypothetical protein
MRGLRTKCFAVDTWEGDDHTGLYGESVYEYVKAFNDTYYSTFSALIRSTFDDALKDFGEGSVDLLHIDGFHTYEAVQHDFGAWNPKLSDRSVVLFHDISVRADDFGVWKLWEELSSKYPSFSFEHSSGLGVLAVGANVPPPVASLCAVHDPVEVARIRDCMKRLSDIAQNTALERDRMPLLEGQIETLRSAVLEATKGLTKRLSGGDLFGRNS